MAKEVVSLFSNNTLLADKIDVDKCLILHLSAV